MRFSLFEISDILTVEKVSIFTSWQPPQKWPHCPAWPQGRRCQTAPALTSWQVPRHWGREDWPPGAKCEIPFREIFFVNLTIAFLFSALSTFSTSFVGVPDLNGNSSSSKSFLEKSKPQKLTTRGSQNYHHLEYTGPGIIGAALLLPLALLFIVRVGSATAFLLFLLPCLILIILVVLVFVLVLVFVTWLVTVQHFAEAFILVNTWRASNCSKDHPIIFESKIQSFS